MRVKDNQTILKRFITKDIEKVYKRYNTITVEEAELVGRFIEKVESNQIEYDIYLDYNITKSLAEALETEDNIDVIKLCILLITEMKLDVELEEVRAIYDKLGCKGYIQIDKYLIYYESMQQELESIAEEKLADDLEDVEKVMELFDEEEVANMWIDGTSLISAAKQYIEDNGWDEALEIKNIERAFVDSNNKQVYCCINEWSDI